VGAFRFVVKIVRLLPIHYLPTPDIGLIVAVDLAGDRHRAAGA